MFNAAMGLESPACAGCKHPLGAAEVSLLLATSDTVPLPWEISKKELVLVRFALQEIGQCSDPSSSKSLGCLSSSKWKPCHCPT